MKPQDSSICIEVTQISPTLHFDPCGDFTHLIKITTRAPVLTDPYVVVPRTRPIYVVAGHDSKRHASHAMTLDPDGEGIREILDSAAFHNSEKHFAQ